MGDAGIRVGCVRTSLSIAHIAKDAMYAPPARGRRGEVFGSREDVDQNRGVPVSIELESMENSTGQFPKRRLAKAFMTLTPITTGYCVWTGFRFWGYFWPGAPSFLKERVGDACIPVGCVRESAYSSFTIAGLPLR